ARQDFDLEVLILVETLGVGDVIAGELALGHPFELQGHTLSSAVAAPVATSTRAPASSAFSVVFMSLSSITPGHGGRTDARMSRRARRARSGRRRPSRPAPPPPRSPTPCRR